MAILRLAAGFVAPIVAFCAISEPYPWLNSGGFTGPQVNASVDPLVAFQWAPGANYSALQIYAVAPALVAAAPATAASNLSSLVSATYGAGSASIAASVQLLVDFGVEHGAWLEIQTGDSRGFPAYVSVTAIISEYNAPRPGGFIALSAYPGGFYRLETNKALYDGLRYAFVSIQFRPGCTPASCPPVRLAGVRAVCQVLPLNYTGAFSSGDAELDAIWYMGAWATRVNILPGFFGSELLARGDRAVRGGERRGGGSRQAACKCAATLTTLSPPPLPSSNSLPSRATPTWPRPSGWPLSGGRRRSPPSCAPCEEDGGGRGRGP